MAGVSVRIKIIAVIGVFMLVLAMVIGAVAGSLIRPSFEKIEQSQATQNLARVREALNADLESLSRSALDWAMWDDAHAFVTEGYEPFARTNLHLNSFANLNIQGLVLVDKSGRVLWSGEPAGEARLRAFADAEDPQSALMALIRAFDGKRAVAGLLRTSRGLMLVAGHPVTDTAAELPPAGLLLMMRRIDHGLIERLGGRLRLNLEADFLSPTEQASANFGEDMPDFTRIEFFGDAGLMRIIGELPDIFGGPAMALRLEMPREMMQQANETLMQATWALALSLGLATALMVYLIDRLLLRPLVRMQDGLAKLGQGETQNLSLLLPMDRRDEIGQVAHAIGKMHDEVLHSANHDSLTGLANRRLFVEHLDRMARLARRDGRQVALFLIDLDGFKPVNDSFGHDMGDRLLFMVAERLRKAVRDADILGRIGGDEFTVAGVLTAPGDEKLFARRILAQFTAPFQIGEGLAVRVGCSIGCAVFPDHAVAISDLIKRADTAMYEAKRAGKNAFRVHIPDQAEQTALDLPEPII